MSKATWNYDGIKSLDSGQLSKEEKENKMFQNKSRHLGTAVLIFAFLLIKVSLLISGIHINHASLAAVSIFPQSKDHWWRKTDKLDAQGGIWKLKLFPVC